MKEGESLYIMHGWIVTRMFDGRQWRPRDRRRLSRCRRAIDRLLAAQQRRFMQEQPQQKA